MPDIGPITDSYIDSIIKANGSSNSDPDKTQGVGLRELIKLMRDRFEQEIAALSDGEFVPYTGANQPLDLGGYNFTTTGNIYASYAQLGNLVVAAGGNGIQDSDGIHYIKGNGLSSNVILGDGSYAPYSNPSGFVPYTGAAANIVIGNHSLTTSDGSNSTTVEVGSIDITNNTGSVNLLKTSNAGIHTSYGIGSIVNSFDGATVYTYTLPSANGTIALTNGIPSITGLVPYTGATASVDLGSHDFSAHNVNGVGALFDNLIITGENGIDIKNGRAITFESGGGSDPLWQLFSQGTDLALRKSNGTVFINFPTANGTIALVSDLTSGYVPYSGATADVDLGSNNLLVGGNIESNTIGTNGAGFTAGDINNGDFMRFTNYYFGYMSSDLSRTKHTDINFATPTGANTITIPNASGTILLNNGSSSDVILGDGTYAPYGGGSSGDFVPYTGATADVDLGNRNLTTTNDITTGHLQLTNLDEGDVFGNILPRDLLLTAGDGVSRTQPYRFTFIFPVGATLGDYRTFVSFTPYDGVYAPEIHLLVHAINGTGYDTSDAEYRFMASSVTGTWQEIKPSYYIPTLSFPADVSLNVVLEIQSIDGIIYIRARRKSLEVDSVNSTLYIWVDNTPTWTLGTVTGTGNDSSPFTTYSESPFTQYNNNLYDNNGALFVKGGDFVPYTGAASDVDLGGNGLTTASLSVATSRFTVDSVGIALSTASYTPNHVLTIDLSGYIGTNPNSIFDGDTFTQANSISASPNGLQIFGKSQATRMAIQGIDGPNAPYQFEGSLIYQYDNGNGLFIYKQTIDANHGDWFRILDSGDTSGFVPYTGAASDLDIGTHAFNAGAATFVGGDVVIAPTFLAIGPQATFNNGIQIPGTGDNGIRFTNTNGAGFDWRIYNGQENGSASLDFSYADNANGIQFIGSDIFDSTGLKFLKNTATPGSSSTNTVTHKIKVNIGGTDYYLLASTSAT